ncbi:MAG: DUF4157 domain-containing protein [Oscillibacter sp.]|nr:DUF4157 domain-containing protein [Oscillibacter sp.]
MRKYASKKSDSRPTAAQTAAQAVSDNPGIPMSSMRSMLMQKAMNDRSHRIDLPEAMRAKMEAAFGMNFGNVNLYESESVADAGAQAIARGDSIAFAPGKADFNNLSGQSLLGHELSHVAAQARGEVTGSGFLDNGALEARADREGALAAAGEQVYDGPVTDAPSFSAAAPMQAKGPRNGEPEKDFSEMDDMEKTERILEAKKQAEMAADMRHQTELWQKGQSLPKKNQYSEESEKARAMKEFSENPKFKPEFKEYKRRQRRRNAIDEGMFDNDSLMYMNQMNLKAAHRIAEDVPEIRPLLNMSPDEKERKKQMELKEKINSGEYTPFKAAEPDEEPNVPFHRSENKPKTVKPSVKKADTETPEVMKQEAMKVPVKPSKGSKVGFGRMTPEQMAECMKLVRTAENNKKDAPPPNPTTYKTKYQDVGITDNQMKEYMDIFKKARAKKDG